MAFCSRLVFHENGLSGSHEQGKSLQKDMPLILKGTSRLSKRLTSSLAEALLLSSTSEYAWALLPWSLVAPRGSQPLPVRLTPM